MTQHNNASKLAADIAEEFNKFEQSDEYREMIRQHVKKAISDSLGNILGYCSDFRRNMEQAMKDAMPNDINKSVDLVKFTTLMAQTMQTVWAENALPEQIAIKTKGVVLDFIKGFEVPKFITMTELIETFIEDNQEDAAQENWSKPHIFFKLRRDYDQKYIEFGIEDHQEESSSYRYKADKDHAFQFANNLYFSATGEEHEGHKTFTAYSGRIDNTPLGNSEIKQFYSNFEKLVAYLYYGGTKLVLDTDDMDDFYYENNDY